MGKTSKNRRGGHSAVRRSGSGSGVPASVSLSTFRASRALDALAPAFVQWFDDGTPGAAAVAMQCLKQVEGVLGRYLESPAARYVTALDPFALAIAVADEIGAEASGPGGVENAENAEMPLWSQRLSMPTLTSWPKPADGLAPQSSWPESVSSSTRFRRIWTERTASTFRRFRRMRRWPCSQEYRSSNGPPHCCAGSETGSPVTGTGALRLRDVEAAAACVGVTVTGSTKRGDPADAVPTVQSMYQVPLLAQMWAALEAAELIDLKPTKVVPFEDYGHFLTGSVSEQLDEFRVFTACFLEQAVLRHDPDQPWGKIIAAVQASVLMAAATPEPPLLQRVLAAPDHAPEAEKRLAGVLTEIAIGRLEALAELGLVTIDTHFRVPSALIGCVADTFDIPWVLSELGIGDASDDF